MENTLIETDFYKLTYSRGDNWCSSYGGKFEIYDKIQEEVYWSEDCFGNYDGTGSKKEAPVKKKAYGIFQYINSKYDKFLSESDKQLVKSIDDMYVPQHIKDTLDIISSIEKKIYNVTDDNIKPILDDINSIKKILNTEIEKIC